MDTQNRNEEEIRQKLELCRENLGQGRYLEAVSCCYQSFADGIMDDDFKQIVVHVALTYRSGHAEKIEFSAPLNQRELDFKIEPENVKIEQQSLAMQTFASEENVAIPIVSSMAADDADIGNIECSDFEMASKESARLDTKAESARLKLESDFPHLQINDETDFSSSNLGVVHKMSWGKMIAKHLGEQDSAASIEVEPYYAIKAEFKPKLTLKNVNKDVGKDEGLVGKVDIDPWPAYPVEDNFIDRSKSGSISKKFILKSMLEHTFQPVEENSAPFAEMNIDTKSEVFELWGDDHVSCDIEPKEISPSLFENVIDFSATEDTNTNLQLVTGQFEDRQSEPREVDLKLLSSFMKVVEERHELGDFSGSLEYVEKILSVDPKHVVALKYMEENEKTLIQMYESKIGSLQGIPQIITRDDEVMWMSLHHRAGFILSQIDGALDYEAIIDVSGMSRLEALKILVGLKNNGVIDV